jgi:hypothetical protein
LVTIPLYVIFRDIRGTVISLVVLISASIFLKKFWYDRLEVGETGEQVREERFDKSVEVVGD